MHVVTASQTAKAIFFFKSIFILCTPFVQFKCIQLPHSLIPKLHRSPPKWPPSYQFLYTGCSVFISF